MKKIEWSDKMFCKDRHGDLLQYKGGKFYIVFSKEELVVSEDFSNPKIPVILQYRQPMHLTSEVNGVSYVVTFRGYDYEETTTNTGDVELGLKLYFKGVINTEFEYSFTIYEDNWKDKLSQILEYI